MLSLRRRWQRLCDELDFAPPNLQHDLPSRDHALKREHHLCFGVLTQAPAGDGRTLEPALRDAFGASGRFTPPLVLLTGVLALGFDPLARLRALADIIDPIGGDDRKLKAALARVDKLAGAPVLANDQRAIDSITDDLLKCYADAGRDLKLEYVEQAAERSVLEQRRYHTRMLLGGEHIRASLSFDGPGSAAAGEAPVPTYLPIALKSELPLLDTMRARLIAELNVRQDQFEAHPLALRVVALGRIIETPYP